MKSLEYHKTPVVEWKDESLPVRMLVKLEYLNHPRASGNKWWKLKYNLAKAQQRGAATLLTFGGPYSNHIFATSAAAHELGLNSIGIIRGEIVSNPTLEFAKANGMKLQFISRDDYRKKNEPEFIKQFEDRFGDFYLIPEGGTNVEALAGCAELAMMLAAEIKFDALCLPVGTGGTIAGMINGLGGEKKIIGFASLKGAAFLETDVRRWLSSARSNWKIQTEYHFGGYARRTRQLDEFISLAREDHGIALDPVYTAKMMFGVLDLARRSEFTEGSTVLVLHTGGLQGGLYDQLT